MKSEIRAWGEATGKAASWMIGAVVAGVLLRVAFLTAYHGLPPKSAVIFIVVTAALGAALRWIGRD